MTIDQHTITTLRQLASNSADLDSQAAMAPETLTALLDHLEETEAHLQRYMRLAEALGCPDGIDDHVAKQQAEALERAIKVMSQPLRDGSGQWVCFAKDLVVMADDYRRTVGRQSR